VTNSIPKFTKQLKPVSSGLQIRLLRRAVLWLTTRAKRRIYME